MIDDGTADTLRLPQHLRDLMADLGMSLTTPGPPASRCCGDCIWKPDEDAGRRARLWPRVAEGTVQACHKGDARMTDAPGSAMRECTGSIVLVRRELDRLEHEFAGDGDAYLAAVPHGLTRDGIAFWREHIEGFDVDLDQDVQHGQGAEQ